MSKKIVFKGTPDGCFLPFEPDLLQLDLQEPNSKEPPSDSRTKQIEDLAKHSPLIQLLANIFKKGVYRLSANLKKITHVAAKCCFFDYCLSKIDHLFSFAVSVLC